MSTIKIKRSQVTATPGSLAEGELAWSEVGGGNLFIGESGSTVTLICEAGSQANTVDSVNALTGVVVLDTDDIGEGISNKYYTEARVSANSDVAANTTHRGVVTGNPHAVTQTEVGLGNVDNTSDADKPVSTATQTALNLKEDDLGTPATSGFVLSSTIGDVRSWIDPSVAAPVQSVNALTGTVVLDTDDIGEGSINLYYTEGRVSANSDVATNTTHRGLTTNPHVVTKAQVGLGNADNTSDANKPVSTAQQTALDLKLDLAGDSMDSGADITFSGGGTVTGLPASTVGVADATSKAYVDDAVAAAISGLDVKDSVRASTTADITLSGTQTIDGVTLIAGNRVLVKDQSTASENGIYDVAAGVWARSSDADTSAEVSSGMYCFTEEGTLNNNAGFILNTPDPIILGTTALDFVQFSGAGATTASLGVQKVGDDFRSDIDGTSLVLTVNTLGVGTVDGGTF